VIHIQIAPKDILDKPTRPGIRMEAFAMSLAVAMILWPVPTNAELVSDSGATDIEIRIGNIMPYTGPLAAFSTMGRAEAAYFDMVNDNGGLNGRKVKFISYDDSSNPRTAVEQTRRLIETDNVLLIFGSFGTPSNLATRSYLNDRKIPQLFVASGAN
jgi:branched-chain amino acid transport system substrate-binding protein